MGPQTNFPWGWGGVTESQMSALEVALRGFPGGLVVRIPRSYCHGQGSILSQETTPSPQKRSSPNAYPMLLHICLSAHTQYMHSAEVPSVASLSIPFLNTPSDGERTSSQDSLFHISYVTALLFPTLPQHGELWACPSSPPD